MPILRNRQPQSTQTTKKTFWESRESHMQLLYSAAQLLKCSCVLTFQVE